MGAAFSGARFRVASFWIGHRFLFSGLIHGFAGRPLRFTRAFNPRFALPFLIDLNFF
jgi:hypothetical protein